MTANAGRAATARARAASRGAVIAALALILTACRLPYIPGYTAPPPSAVADLADSSGKVVGKAVLVEHGSSVRILIDFKGVAPGTKAVHIHTVGRCDAPSFESAGPHFNPGTRQHGTANPAGPHAGDLPNVVIESTGLGHLEFTARATVSKGANSLFDADGSSLVLHEKADDLRTDPDGQSGGRIACGVILKAD
jgi:Cu-Zn family superoxide dismutase